MFGSFFFGQSYFAQPPISGAILMICAGITIAARISMADVLVTPRIAGDIDILVC